MARKRRAAPRSRHLALDTNLWMLLLYGMTDISLVGTKRTSNYSIGDFERLRSFLRVHDSLATTPNIMTEVSNLLKSLLEMTRREIYNRLRVLLANCVETYVESATIIDHPQIATFGLTDIAVLSLAARGCTVLTADSRLADYMRRQALNVVNFSLLAGP